MTPQTFIFIGRSGCGKGTQSQLIQEYLKKNDPEHEILYIQSGAEFREFIKGDSITQKLSKKIYDTGEFQPEFLAIHMWTNILINKYKGNEHMIMDGMPRKYHEAGVLDSIWNFYSIQKPHVIYMDISKEESKKRLLARKRFDDIEAEIDNRLAWFEAEVIPTLDFFKNNPDYDYQVVNGEQDVNKVFADILSQTKI
jgi:adenylate kinase family enzyme